MLTTSKLAGFNYGMFIQSSNGWSNRDAWVSTYVLYAEFVDGSHPIGFDGAASMGLGVESEDGFSNLQKSRRRPKRPFKTAYLNTIEISHLRVHHF